MNAGCFGAQISDNLIDCNILNKNYKIEKLTKKELNFSYRKSSFSNDQIIINARFKTFYSDKKLIKKRLEEISRKRKKVNLYPQEQVEALLQIHHIILHGN